MTDLAMPFGPSPRRPLITPQVLLGLCVMVAGVLFTLDNMEVLHAEDYLRYWPVALVALGGLKLSHASRDGRGWFIGLVLVGLGVVMLVNRIASFTIEARMIFPLFLVAIGGYLVWRGVGGSMKPRAASPASRVSGIAIMSGFVFRSNTPAFEGGDLTAILGGCEVNLTKASIAPGTEAVIDAFAFWGGIELKVPEDWTVVNQVFPLMGGVEDKTVVPEPPTGKHLVLRGIVLMGGISVKN